MRITIAGVVGVGKSTVSELLAFRNNFYIVKEPVETNPYLDQYYADPKAIAFKMQVFMIMARSKQLKQTRAVKNIIYDRSLLEDPIFVETLYSMQLMDQIDYQTYMEFYNVVLMPNLYQNEDIKPDLVVYLKATTSTAIERIKQRGRLSEQQIDEQYWHLLNEKYEQWYDQNKNKLKFLVVDANIYNP